MHKCHSYNYCEFYNIFQQGCIRFQFFLLLPPLPSSILISFPKVDKARILVKELQPLTIPIFPFPSLFYLPTFPRFSTFPSFPFPNYPIFPFYVPPVVPPHSSFLNLSRSLSTFLLPSQPFPPNLTRPYLSTFLLSPSLPSPLYLSPSQPSPPSLPPFYCYTVTLFFSIFSPFSFLFLFPVSFPFPSPPLGL